MNDWVDQVDRPLAFASADPRSSSEVWDLLGRRGGLRLPGRTLGRAWAGGQVGGFELLFVFGGKR
jgi:hypothetical protein